MESNAKRIGLMNLIALLGATIAMLMIARFVSSQTAIMATVLTSFGLLVALLNYFHIGLVEREQFEKMEMEELSKSRGSQSLFTTAGADTFPAKRSREQFERFIIPIFTGLLFAAEAFSAYWFWQTPLITAGVALDKATLAMALLGLFGLILFLLGKYSSGLARLQKQKFLRPSAAYLLLSAYAGFWRFTASACAGGTRACFMKAGSWACLANRKRSLPPPLMPWIINSASKFLKRGSIGFWKRRSGGCSWPNLALWFCPRALSSLRLATKRCWNGSAARSGKMALLGRVCI